MPALIARTGKIKTSHAPPFSFGDVLTYTRDSNRVPSVIKQFLKLVMARVPLTTVFLLFPPSRLYWSEKMPENRQSNLARLWHLGGQHWSNLLWWLLRPRVTLRSGVKLRVSSPSEWELFNEIFVECEYDEAVRRALSSVSSPVHVVDLGANVGFLP